MEVYFLEISSVSNPKFNIKLYFLESSQIAKEINIMLGHKLRIRSRPAKNLIGSGNDARRGPRNEFQLCPYLCLLPLIYLKRLLLSLQFILDNLRTNKNNKQRK